jgi:hypothetical protein
MASSFKADDKGFEISPENAVSARRAIWPGEWVADRFCLPDAQLKAHSAPTGSSRRVC